MTSVQSAPCGHEFTAQRHWSARLNATCAVRRGKTVLTKLDFEGPLNLKALLYPEPPYQGVLPAEAILLHPPGGLVSGDDLRIALTTEPQARLLVTTPAATMVYGTDQYAVPQRQAVHLTVTDSVLEYLPAETIVFDRAQAHLSLEVELRGKGVFIGAETLVLGRKVGAQPFTQGALSQRAVIWRNGHLLLNEHLQLTLPQDQRLLAANCGWAGATVLSTFYAVGPHDEGAALEQLAAKLNGQGLGVTSLHAMLIGRYLGSSVATAERWSFDLWAQVRPVLTKLAARPLRIKNC